MTTNAPTSTIPPIEKCSDFRRTVAPNVHRPFPKHPRPAMNDRPSDVAHPSETTGETPGETPTDRPVVFLTRRLPNSVMRRLENETELTTHTGEHDVTPEQLRHHAGRSDALITLLTDRIDAETIRSAPRLKIVANYAVGYNNIDVDAAKQHGVAVTNTPGVLTEATADLAWALILATTRRVIEGDRLVRQGRWTGWQPEQLLGLELRGATLGIVGLGRIGRATAARAAGFGMKVVAYNRSPIDDEAKQMGIEMMSIDEVCRVADVVSLHTAYTDATHHVIDARRIGLIGDGYIINTARGACIDEAALVDALRKGRLRGAGLDVYENEPDLHPELAQCTNAVMLPHLGSATESTRHHMGMMVVDNVLAACRGDVPPNRVW